MQTTQPTTIDGIKRRAKKLKKEHLISLSKAQNMAAQQAGYRDFHHAHKELTK